MSGAKRTVRCGAVGGGEPGVCIGTRVNGGTAVAESACDSTELGREGFGSVGLGIGGLGVAGVAEVDTSWRTDETDAGSIGDVAAGYTYSSSSLRYLN